MFNILDEITYHKKKFYFFEQIHYKDTFFCFEGRVPLKMEIVVNKDKKVIINKKYKFVNIL